MYTLFIEDDLGSALSKLAAASPHYTAHARAAPHTHAQPLSAQAFQRGARASALCVTSVCLHTHSAHSFSQNTEHEALYKADVTVKAT